MFCKNVCFISWNLECGLYDKHWLQCYRLGYIASIYEWVRLHVWYCGLPFVTICQPDHLTETFGYTRDFNQQHKMVVVFPFCVSLICSTSRNKPSVTITWQITQLTTETLKTCANLSHTIVCIFKPQKNHACICIISACLVFVTNVSVSNSIIHQVMIKSLAPTSYINTSDCKKWSGLPAQNGGSVCTSKTSRDYFRNPAHLFQKAKRRPNVNSNRILRLIFKKYVYTISQNLPKDYEYVVSYIKLMYSIFTLKIKERCKQKRQGTLALFTAGILASTT